MSKQEYYRLGNCTESWFYETCTLPQFTDSFFSIDESNSSNITLLSTDGESIISPNISAQIHDEQDSGSVADSEETYDIFKTLRDLRKGNIKRPILCHITINSLRYKFNDLKPILIDRLCDILVISETKLDDSFNNNLFAVNGYKLERKDRNAKGGGIMVFFRADLPVRRINNLECEQSETIFLELKLNNRTWGILCSYRPPSTNDSLFEKDLCSILDQSFIKYDHLCYVSLVT